MSLCLCVCAPYGIGNSRRGKRNVRFPELLVKGYCELLGIGPGPQLEAQQETLTAEPSLQSPVM